MSNSSNVKKVLIAGGGLGGMTAALSLLKRGIDVEVFEQASELKEVGAGLHVAPNAFRVLDEIGLAQEALKTACVAAGREVRLWNTGDTWPVFDLGVKSVEQYGFPSCTMYRLLFWLMVCVLSSLMQFISKVLVKVLSKMQTA